ncbi:Two-component system sensor histidine kinase [Olavius algarvensis Delta 1 endosymbiont]|nr:Two-component system sensor histidine kinase [Olavius algarvensis Delta 1 endosymbiont]
MTKDRHPPPNNNRKLGSQDHDIESKTDRRRYSDYFEFAPVGYFTFDRDGVILNVNPDGALLLGTERRRLLNQPFVAYIASDSRAVFEAHCRGLFQAGEKQTCDLRLLIDDGRSPWVQLESVPIRNGHGAFDQIRTVIKEITDRKLTEDKLRKARDGLAQTVNDRTTELEKINEQLRTQVFECEMAEAALRDSENKYSTLVKDALIGVYINKDGKIEFANDKFAAIYGYPKNDLIGMESTILVHPEDRTRVEEMRKKRLRGEKVPSEYEIRGLKKNGDTIWVMRSLSLINYQDGPAVSGIVQDMTKRRMAEQALRESDKELRILSNQLLSTEEKERKRIARELHDGIGQALSAIKFSVENSLRELRRSPDHAEFKSLETVIPLTQKTIEEVRRIVKDLRPSILDDLGILATITWFCREFRKVYASIRIIIEIEIQESDIHSPLKTVIYRILQEALNNVAKHSRADRVHLSLHKKDNGVELTVHDNGAGFDLSEALSLQPSRRGFGLTSMRERAELSGGKFGIESVIGKGTTIWVKWQK